MADIEPDGLPDELEHEALDDGDRSGQSSAEESGTGTTRGRGRAKSRAQPKSRAKGSNRLKVLNDKGKSRNRVTKDGKKFCPACGKTLPVTDFPAGSGQCAKDRKAIQVLRNCAVNQNQLEWWERNHARPQEAQESDRGVPCTGTSSRQEAEGAIQHLAVHRRTPARKRRDL